jgi:hypothetical protein
MKYIMIINKDRKGLVAEISELLGQNRINIDSIHAVSQDGFAGIRLFTPDNDRALSILNESGFKAVPDENILVRIEDTPGSLGRISRTLSENRIDIRGITMIEQNQGFNIVAIVTDQDVRAREILTDVLVE